MNREDWQNLPLGQETKYESSYNPALLHPIPRSVSRAYLGLAEGAALPFHGEDEWWGFELSWLNAKGMPQVAVARFTFAAESPAMIESKSFKLYLNSFNQTQFSSWDSVRETLIDDLTRACGAAAKVLLLDVEDDSLTPAKPQGFCLDALDIEVQSYQPDASLLRADASRGEVQETLYSHLLRSNCPVTGQPDWGTVVVQYRGQAIDREGLLAYIISFREHQDFHEHCVERIFCDLQRAFAFGELTVCARYTRRGGLDINPLRSTQVGKKLPPRFARQ